MTGSRSSDRSKWRPFRSFLDRTRRERLLLVEATFFVIGARMALTLLPFRWLRSARRPIVRLASLLRARPIDVDIVSRCVRAAARHVTDATCLTQAISLHLML